MPLKLTSEIYQAVLENLPIGVYMTDLQRQIISWNTRAERITGFLGQEVIGHFCHDNLLMHCDERQVVLCGSACPLAHTMLDGSPRETSLFLRHKDGQRIPVHVRAIPIRDEAGVVVGAAEFFEIRAFRETELRSSPHREKLALDAVMEVPDHQATLAVIGAAVEQFAVSQSPFGVLSIAVDQLEHVRHVYGRQAVDEVLYAAAQTLSSGTRPEDLIGCGAGDQFAALIACPTAEGIERCAERLQRLVSLAAVPWWGDRLSVSVSIGGTMIRPGDTLELLLSRADIALASAAQPGSISIV